MPKIRFANQTIYCNEGDNLRRVLMQSKLPIYNGPARVLNCRGSGVCGQCAVRLRGTTSWPSASESARLKLIPGSSDIGLRLACQCTVLGDLSVEKFGGVWSNDTHVATG